MGPAWPGACGRCCRPSVAKVSQVTGIRKEQKPGLFVPVIDRAKCEGGYHHACADAKCPCVPACAYSVLEIRPVTTEDKRLLGLHDRLRAWVHGSRQVYVVMGDACTACARCVEACPVPHVIKLRRRAPT